MSADPVRMYDDAGFIILSSVSALAVVSSFAGLLWAAVRDERAFRRTIGPCR